MVLQGTLAPKSISCKWGKWAIFNVVSEATGWVTHPTLPGQKTRDCTVCTWNMLVWNPFRLVYCFMILFQVLDWLPCWYFQFRVVVTSFKLPRRFLAMRKPSVPSHRILALWGIPFMDLVNSLLNKDSLIPYNKWINPNFSAGILPQHEILGPQIPNKILRGGCFFSRKPHSFRHAFEDCLGLVPAAGGSHWRVAWYCSTALWHDHPIGAIFF